MRKKNWIAVFVLLCILPTMAAAKPKGEPKWKLVWKENFNQRKGIDTKVWSKIPRGGSDWNNYMSDFDSCYAVKKGNLILRGINNYSLPNDTAPYLTGGVYTKDKMTFTTGKIEIKAKLQAAKGAWPAIWMLPQNEPWPMGGEIDVMERLNFDTIAYQTVHTNYTYNLGIKTPSNGSTGAINPADYNIYAVEITPDSLVFSINHKKTFSYPRVETDKKGQFPFVQPFYLLIDMQLGGSWVGPVNPADLPVEMKIDWVRYYQRKE